MSHLVDTWYEQREQYKDLSMLKISPVITEISQQGSPYFLIATVLHRKRPKTPFFNLLCIYSVRVHGSGTSFISN